MYAVSHDQEHRGQEVCIFALQIPLGRQLLVDLNHMREVGPGDDTKYRGIEGKPERGEGKPWARVWNGPEHIVFGHDHKRGLQASSNDWQSYYQSFCLGPL